MKRWRIVMGAMMTLSGFCGWLEWGWRVVVWWLIGMCAGYYAGRLAEMDENEREGER